MKRLILFIGILIIFIPLTALSTAALSQSEIIESQEDISGLKNATDLLPSETLDALEQLGIDAQHPTEGMKKFTLSDLFLYFKRQFFHVISPAVKSLALILAVIFLSALFTFENNRVLHAVVIAAASIAVISPILTFFNSTAYAIGVCTDFTTAMVPVFASFMLTSGLPVSSGALSGCILLLSRGISVIASSLLLPIACGGLSLSTVGAFVPDLKTESIASSIRKFVIWAVGAVLVIYLTYLGIQSGITSSLDGLAQKTAKLTVSSSIPIVGSIISDASDTVFGAAQLIKSGLGGFSFIAIALIFIKPILLGISWMAALKVGEFAASSFGCDDVSTLTGAVSKTVSVVISMLAASAVALIISIAIMVNLRM